MAEESTPASIAEAAATVRERRADVREVLETLLEVDAVHEEL